VESMHSLNRGNDCTYASPRPVLPRHRSSATPTTFTYKKKEEPQPGETPIPRWSVLGVQSPYPNARPLLVQRGMEGYNRLSPTILHSEGTVLWAVGKEAA
jgi:hypothetical protein